MEAKDTYRVAKELIKQLGLEMAKEKAEFELQRYLEMQDTKASGFWLGISCAIDELLSLDASDKSIH